MERIDPGLSGEVPMPSHDVQVERLTAWQFTFQHVLTECGLIEAAIDCLPQEIRRLEPAREAPVRPGRAFPLGDDPSVKLAQIVFAFRPPDGDPDATALYPVTVCETNGATPTPYPAFPNAKVAEDAVMRLEFERITGGLPSLSRDCTYIIRQFD